MLLNKVQVLANVKVDFIHIEEQNDNNKDIFAINQFKPSLNNDSRFLVTFDDNNLVSQGIASQALGFTFSVYKEDKQSESGELEYVARLNDGSLSINDYNIVNNDSYVYYIFKEDETKISSAVLSNEVNTCWGNWSIVDVKVDTENPKLYYANSNTMWLLDLNLSSASKEQNINTTTYNNLTKYPKVSFGNTNYSSSSITCLLGALEKVGEQGISYIEPATKLEQWNTFANNGNIKLLRDRKGNSMLVAITSTSSQIDDVTREQATTITFNWVQVQDTHGISIIG